MSTYLEHRRKLKLEGKPPKGKKTYRIPRESKKRAKINREYAKLTKPLWEGKGCEIRAPGCWKQAQGMHHIRGKVTKERLLNTDEMVPACNHCNSYVEQFTEWAKEKGFKRSRFNKVN